MSVSSMQERVENYFSSISPMARRILVDSETVKQKNEGRWDKMPYEDQCRLIMDALVKDKVGDRYSFYPQNKPDYESFPKLCVRSGEKYVVDEENQGKGSGNTWRDEHSGPFTWETQSQLNFSIVDNPKKEPPIPRKAPPVDRLNNSKFYKVLPSKKPMPSDHEAKLEPFKEDIGNDVSDSRCVANQLQTFGGKKAAPPLADRPKVTANEVANESNFKPKDQLHGEIPTVVSTHSRNVEEGPCGKDRKDREVKKTEPTKKGPSTSVRAEAQAGETTLCAAMNDLTLDLDLSPSKDSNIPKTGFDFLDDW